MPIVFGRFGPNSLGSGTGYFSDEAGNYFQGTGNRFSAIESGLTQLSAPPRGESATIHTFGAGAVREHEQVASSVNLRPATMPLTPRGTR